MRINAHIIGVEDCGETIGVRIQGRAQRAPHWQDFDAFTFKLPASNFNKSRYHLGRQLTITIKPKGRF